MIALIDVSDW